MLSICDALRPLSIGSFVPEKELLRPLKAVA
jgi:hypothetical protein